MPKKTSPAAGNSPASAAAPRQRTCFVVTGFGNKTDYATGRVLNLDKTYEQLVRPACDAVKVNAFRAIDANHTIEHGACWRLLNEARNLALRDRETLPVDDRAGRIRDGQ